MAKCSRIPGWEYEVEGGSVLILRLAQHHSHFVVRENGRSNRVVGGCSLRNWFHAGVRRRPKERNTCVCVRERVQCEFQGAHNRKMRARERGRQREGERDGKKSGRPASNSQICMWKRAILFCCCCWLLRSDYLCPAESQTELQLALMWISPVLNQPLK